METHYSWNEIAHFDCANYYGEILSMQLGHIQQSLES